MPVLDGLGVVSEVRGGEWPGYVFTILLTGRDSQASVLAGLEAGADDYLKKPVDEAELLARMKTGWRIAELERRLRAAQQEALRLSLIDSLTGASNRRELVDRLPSEVERARRYNHPLSVVMCDIDHFKRINDSHCVRSRRSCAPPSATASTGWRATVARNSSSCSRRPISRVPARWPKNCARGPRRSALRTATA
jgi:PleD family two-component response regulator